MPFELRTTFPEAPDRDRFRPLAFRIAGMGVRRIRLLVRWPSVEPEPEVYKWDDFDAAIEAIREAGMGVYADVVDAPAHALGYLNDDGTWTPHPWGGYRYWLPPDAGQVLPTCWKPEDPATHRGGPFDPIYDTSISPECANPPRVMPACTRRFASALVRHCMERGITDVHFGYGNEMDSENFFPLWVLVRTKYNGEWAAVTRMIYNDVTRPFAQGVKDVDPDAFVEANESATYGMLIETLRSEKEAGDHLIDGIATHGYPDADFLGFPAGAIDRITRTNGGLLKYLSDSGLQNGRPWGIGEVGLNPDDDVMSILDYLPVMCHLGAQWVTLMEAERFFVPGTYANGTYEPGDVYRGIAAQMSRFTARHRAARS
jgi:hypothetical protein